MSSPITIGQINSRFRCLFEVSLHSYCTLGDCKNLMSIKMSIWFSLEMFSRLRWFMISINFLEISSEGCIFERANPILQGATTWLNASVCLERTSVWYSLQNCWLNTSLLSILSRFSGREERCLAEILSVCVLPERCRLYRQLFAISSICLLYSIAFKSIENITLSTNSLVDSSLV